MAKEQQKQVLEAPDLKWHGKVRMEIQASIGRVWAVASNFCGLRSWIPTLDFCVRSDGEEQTPGCVRYVAGSTFPRADGQKSWAKERLLCIDNTRLCYSYVMEDGNMGLRGYIARFQLFQGSDSESTFVEWSFEMDPSISASGKDEVIAKQIAFLSAAVKKLEFSATRPTSLHN